LELPTRQLGDLAVEDLNQFEFLAHQLLVIELQLRIKHLGYGEGSLDSPRYVVHILRLDQRFKVVLENLGEVILQFRASEIFQNLFPIRGVLKRRERGS